MPAAAHFEAEPPSLPGHDLLIFVLLGYIISLVGSPREYATVVIRAAVKDPHVENPSA